MEFSKAVFAAFSMVLSFCCLEFLLYSNDLGFIRTIGLTEMPLPTVHGSNQVIPKPKKKLILVYTPLFGNRAWYHLPEKDAANFTRARKCRVDNCEITYDNNRFAESDAAIFHARDMPSAASLRNLSATSRPLHQRWVYFISENPYNTANPAPLDGLFNWTMTYKKESDIWIPYQRYIRLEPEAPRPKIIDHAAEKNKVKDRKLALWVVSHCRRLRDKLVKKLEEYVSIEVGGGCGRLFKHAVGDCKSKHKEGCIKAIRQYKFYLAFENEFCDQYVTEKYWYNALTNDAVPVVMGAGPYNDLNVAIPGTFINVADFKSVKDLANYLTYLDRNDTAYNEYFKWKQSYRLTVDLGWPYPGIWGCEICEKLHNNHQTRIYDKLSEFWSTNIDCKGKEKTVSDMISRS